MELAGSPHFMELAGSLPHSQMPANYPYSEPPKSSPYFHILKIHLNIILPFTLGCSLKLLHQNPVYASPLSHTCYMLRPSHSSRLYHPNKTGWLQITGTSLLLLIYSCFILKSGIGLVN
jgi:hypothetical protein